MAKDYILEITKLTQLTEALNNYAHYILGAMQGSMQGQKKRLHICRSETTSRGGIYEIQRQDYYQANRWALVG